MKPIKTIPNGNLVKGYFEDWDSIYEKPLSVDKYGRVIVNIPDSPSYKQINDIITLLQNIKIFTDNDVNLDTSNFTGNIADLNKLTDLDMTTYAIFKGNQNDSITINFNEPVKTSKLYIFQLNSPICGFENNKYIDVYIYYTGETSPYKTRVLTCSITPLHPYNLITINTDSTKEIGAMMISFVNSQTLDLGFIGMENPKEISIYDDKVGLNKEVTQQTIENEVNDLSPKNSDYVELKFNGSYDNGTYTQTYTPQNGEIDYIDLITLNSNDGKGDLWIDYDGDIKGKISVYYFYHVLNAEQHIKIKIIGDGSKQITLTLNVGFNGHYFGKAIIWKVKR